MVGMVAFIADVPHRVTDATTVLPVQIYLWAANPDPGFGMRAASAMLLLLCLLLVCNVVVGYCRGYCARKLV
jgi:phosphate transport system permease protein